MTVTAERPTSAPEKRAASAARAVARAEQKVAAAREERDAAAHHLLRNEGWPPVRVYSLIGMSRGLFARMIAAREQRSADVPAVQNPERVAKRAAAAFVKAKAAEETARRERSEAVEEMLARGDSNADVARASGLTTARITQVRQGRR